MKEFKPISIFARKLHLWCLTESLIHRCSVLPSFYTTKIQKISWSIRKISWCQRFKGNCVGFELFFCIHCSLWKMNFSAFSLLVQLHRTKKWIFPLKASSLNVTKSGVNFEQTHAGWEMWLYEPLEVQRHIQNPMAHLRWSVLRK